MIFLSETRKDGFIGIWMCFSGRFYANSFSQINEFSSSSLLPSMFWESSSILCELVIRLRSESEVLSAVSTRFDEGFEATISDGCCRWTSFLLSRGSLISGARMVLQSISGLRVEMMCFEGRVETDPSNPGQIRFHKSRPEPASSPISPLAVCFGFFGSRSALEFIEIGSNDSTEGSSNHYEKDSTSLGVFDCALMGIGSLIALRGWCEVVLMDLVLGSWFVLFWIVWLWGIGGDYWVLSGDRRRQCSILSDVFLCLVYSKLLGFFTFQEVGNSIYRRYKDIKRAMKKKWMSGWVLVKWWQQVVNGGVSTSGCLKLRYYWPRVSFSELDPIFERWLVINVYQRVHFSKTEQEPFGFVAWVLLYLVVLVLCRAGPERRLYVCVSIGSWYIRANLVGF